MEIFLNDFILIKYIQLPIKFCIEYFLEFLYTILKDQLA